MPRIPKGIGLTGYSVGPQVGYRGQGAIDVSSEDYEPGFQFVLYINAPTDDPGSDSTVSAVYLDGSAATITFADGSESTRVNAPDGEMMLFQKVNNSGTTLQTGVTLTALIP